MKYQNRLLFLFKILRIISVVILILSVVSFLLHAFLAVVSTIGSLEKFYTMLATYYPYETSITIEHTVYYVCRAIFDVSAIIISILLFSYFKKVIDAGTPFTIKLAKNLFRVSMVNIFLPIITTSAAVVLYKIYGMELTKAMSDVSDIIMGVCELLFYLFVRAAIEMNENSKQEKAE